VSRGFNLFEDYDVHTMALIKLYCMNSKMYALITYHNSVLFRKRLIYIYIYIIYKSNVFEFMQQSLISVMVCSSCVCVLDLTRTLFFLTENLIPLY